MGNNELYYKRGLYMIDKFLKEFTNDSSFYRKRASLVEREYLRYSNFKEIASKDMNSFILTGLVAILGMNKENIERIDKHADYDFSILNKQGLKEVEKLKEKNPLFEKDRIVNTKYDSWLNVLNLDHPTIDYMYNVRNGFLHSEYDFYDEYGNTIYVKNSNYTKFEGKILLTSFIDFALFYFGNSVWSGLSENTKLYNVVTDGQIKTEKELQNVLDQLQIVTIDYKLKKDNSTNVSPENKLYNLAKKGLITDYNYQKELDR